MIHFVFIKNVVTLYAYDRADYKIGNRKHMNTSIYGTRPNKHTHTHEQSRKISFLVGLSFKNDKI